MKNLNKTALLLAVSLTALFSVSGCGDPRVINGVKYDTYGLFDEAEKRNPDIEYELITGNVVWSVILVETVAAPVYFVGFSMYEPIGLKDKTKPIGAIN